MFDEPTNYLDDDKKEMFLNLIPNLQENHIILIITHDPVFETRKGDYQILQIKK